MSEKTTTTTERQKVKGTKWLIGGEKEEGTELGLNETQPKISHTTIFLSVMQSWFEGLSLKMLQKLLLG